MGLDWNPGPKPRVGHEEEFDRLCSAILQQSIHEGSPEYDRFFEISISAYETLGAPRIGFDPEATEWMRGKYLEQQQAQIPAPKGWRKLLQRKRRPQPHPMSEAEWLEQFRGRYVLELVPPCDGIPPYSNCWMGYVECFSFRAKFLLDCESILPKRVLEQAYVTKDSKATLQYGRELISLGESYARSAGVDPLTCKPLGNEVGKESSQHKSHVILTAGRWCVFWAERGHMLEAYW